MEIFLFVGLIGACWAAAVATSKNNSAVGYGLLGFLFPLIGVIAAHAAKPTPTAITDHMRAS